MTEPSHPFNRQQDYTKHVYERQEGEHDQPLAIINRGRHRMIDKHTGREVIVLE